MAAGVQPGLLFAVVLLTAVAGAEDYGGATPPTRGNSTAFIRSCCAKTLYQHVCVDSLAGSAGEVNSDPVRLAVAATNVTAAFLRGLATRVSALRSSEVAVGRNNGPEATALKVCATVVSSALGLTKQASSRLVGLETATGPEIAWCVDDVQTWLSAAMTDEATCEDEFKSAVRSARPPVPTTRPDLFAAVRKAKQYTSNALALVNMLVNG